jgi:hypothetical protein
LPAIQGEEETVDEAKIAVYGILVPMLENQECFENHRYGGACKK